MTPEIYGELVITRILTKIDKIVPFEAFLLDTGNSFMLHAV